jgi:hypothetical protein
LPGAVENLRHVAHTATYITTSGAKTA